MPKIQKTISLQPFSRGFHLVTRELLEQLPEIRGFDIGIAHFFIQHTSASLTINENADLTVRSDMETHINKMVPEDLPYYQHTLEGSDDMPAHIKSVIIGSSISIPISSGSLNLGTWQGIYLFEHRIDSHTRKISHHFIGK